MADLDDDYTEWDLYDIPHSTNYQVDVSLPNKSEEFSTELALDEESRIKALVEKSALDCEQPSSSSCGFGYGRGMIRGGKIMGGSGFGRGSGLPWKKPPEGYVCHRCKVAGHFIQHCPTNGDPNYDFKKMKPPTGIPKSMLMSNSDGFYAVSSGDIAVLKPDEVAFEREIEGLPTTRSRHIGDVPKELYCQLCKQIMNFAVLCSKCCFQSFCDQCIRNYISSKFSCVCGATEILADDLLPNLTLRKTINRIVESHDDGSLDNGGCSFPQVQDKESNNVQEDKVPSTTKLTASVKEVAVADEVAEEGMADNCAVEGNVVDLEELAPKQGTTLPLADEEYRKEAKTKKRKKVHMPLDDSAMQGNYMMPMEYAGYNPYWFTGIQSGMAGYFTPYSGAYPYFGFGFNPLAMSYGGILPQDQFAGSQFVSNNREGFDESEMGASLKDQELDKAVSSCSDTTVLSKSSSEHDDQHQPRRPSSPDRRGHAHKDYERPRRHLDHEHHRYKGNIEQHHYGNAEDWHHREHHKRSRHHSVRAYH
ncbi:hypothetical protein M9H77_05878 [Catharanthus roseus]|uniref:Uncharacterized protein n=1 Tax=Catharanthus roseus TaxID=4058 RepID=A0ACC0BQQ8_CATRO|nr:hypothetical protein M9H77_05878 [Catharanthus roseus]